MNQITPDEVRLWLEWAGGKMLSIEVRNTRPGSYRSFWPDYPDDKFTAYGYSGERLYPGRPNSYEISLMDEVLNLVVLIPLPLTRRIINARSLVHPLNNRYLYSWSRIAEIIHSDRRMVKRQHRRGLEEISCAVGSEIVNRVRGSLGTHAEIA